MQIRTVLCPIDFTELSDRAMRLAVEICQRYGARLVFHHNLDVRPPNYLSVAWMWSETHEAEEEEKAAKVPERLEEIFDRVPPAIQYEARVTRGPMDTSLLYLARELPADLIVMGSHGWTDSAHRSLTELIIIKSRCPVLTLEEDSHGRALSDPESGESSKVVVPVDFTPRSQAALDYAFGLAAEMPLELHLLHVVGSTLSSGENESERRLDEAESRLQGLVPPAAKEWTTATVISGEPAESIRGFVCEMGADFVVMAAHGKNLLQRWMSGTTTLEILHGSCCPVWFVPGTWGVGMPVETDGRGVEARISGEG